MKNVVLVIEMWQLSYLQFNRIPMNGINFLEVHNLVPHDPKAVAQFLKDTPGLDRVPVLFSCVNLNNFTIFIFEILPCFEAL
jgi:hypothetical protein